MLSPHIHTTGLVPGPQPDPRERPGPGRPEHLSHPMPPLVEKRRRDVGTAARPKDCPPACTPTNQPTPACRLPAGESGPRSPTPRVSTRAPAPADADAAAPHTPAASGSTERTPDGSTRNFSHPFPLHPAPHQAHRPDEIAPERRRRATRPRLASDDKLQGRRRLIRTASPTPRKQHQLRSRSPGESARSGRNPRYPRSPAGEGHREGAAAGARGGRRTARLGTGRPSRRPRRHRSGRPRTGRQDGRTWTDRTG